MGTPATRSNSGNLLKTIFGDEDPAWVALQRCKLLSEIEIDGSWGGDDLSPVVVSYQDGAGISPDFSTAQAEAKETGESRFSLVGRKLYAVKYIDGELIARTKSNRMAYARAVEHNLKRATWAFNNVVSQVIWSKGGGSVGQLPATVTLTGATVTFTDGTNDLIEVGRSYQFASDNGTAASPAGLYASTSLKCISKSGTTVTFDANLNTVAGIAASAYIFLKGSYAVAMNGLLGWLPITAPTAGDSFLGVDRSTHVERLAGVRHSADSGGLKIDNIRNGIAVAQSKGARPTRIYTNPLDFADVVGEMQGQYEWEPLGSANPKLGHKGIHFEGSSGAVALVSEEFCPRGYYFGVDPKDIKFKLTSTELPMLLNEDGIKQMLRAATADAYEVRLGIYGPGIVHHNPGNSLIGTF